MFLVIKLTNPPPHIKGYLSRFTVEVESNLFVGTCSRRVADNLWERIINSNEDFKATKIESANNESGFLILYYNGITTNTFIREREIKNYDDFELPTRTLS